MRHTYVRLVVRWTVRAEGVVLQDHLPVTTAHAQSVREDGIAPVAAKARLAAHRAVLINEKTKEEVIMHIL
jgi:hypothetical protein